MPRSTTANSQRLAKNTLLLYCRTFFTLIIGLYTSRVVLNALGVEDFGIYNVVGGVVGMFALISGSMTAATQRFIAYELGKEDGDSNHVFSATLTIHILIALVIIFFAETVGLWFVNAKLNVASDKMYAANWVYQFSVLTFVVNIISIPYNGLIIAHERMDAFAVISIVEAILKLIAVISLTLFLQERLIIYAAFMFLVALIIRIIFGVFCSRSFNDSKYRFKRRSPVYRQILGFTGWNVLGSSSAILGNQGINLLVNNFFGVIPNAARGIAQQVDNALQGFVNNFTVALNPQITKAYASGDSAYVMTLVNQGAKFCFYLFLIGAAPIICFASEILELWLKIVPDYAVVFVQLSLVYILIQTWSQTLYILMLATGDIKKYQIVVGGTSLLSFPLTWVLYLLGMDVSACYYALIFVGILCLILRLVILSQRTNLAPRAFIMGVILPNLLVCLVVAVIAMALGKLNIHWIFSIIVFVPLELGVIYYLGLNKSERKTALSYIKKLRKKISL